MAEFPGSTRAILCSTSDSRLRAKYRTYPSGTTVLKAELVGCPRLETSTGSLQPGDQLPTWTVLLGVKSGPTQPALTTRWACSFPRAGSDLGRGWAVVRQPPRQKSAFHSAISGLPTCFGQIALPPLKQGINEELATSVFHRSGLPEHGHHLIQHALRKILQSQSHSKMELTVCNDHKCNSSSLI